MFLSKSLSFDWFLDLFINQKIISLDQFDANIDGIVLNLEYWGEKAVLL